MKVISVIIPCFNVEKYIDRCLSSVVCQTIGIESMEIICVDDCSTDNTLDHLKEWEEKYPENFIIVSMDSNEGQSTARNTGLSYASGDYIAFIDADDWIEKDYLEQMYKLASSNDFDIVQCEYVRNSSEELVYLENKESSDPAMNSYLIDNKQKRKDLIANKIISSNAPFKLIRKKLLTDNSIFFYDGLRYEDISFGLLLSLYADKVGILHDKLYHYYVNASSTVLKKNETYHTDILTNWVIFWNDVNSRGLFECYKDEIELEFVYSCILIFWKIMVLRFDDPPYPYYRLLCSLVKELTPNIQKNPYIANSSLSEFHALILSGTLNELSKADFIHLCDNIRKIGL